MRRESSAFCISLSNYILSSLAFLSILWCIACMSNQEKLSQKAEASQETRERIIATASKVLAEKGYDATTLREISREAQTAPQSSN